MLPSLPAPVEPPVLPGAALLLWAAGLVALAGFVAMADAAFGAVSPARAAELARSGRRGATALHAVALDPPRHVNLLLLVRLVCELTATTLVALVAVSAFGIGWAAALVTAGTMTVVSFVVVGVGPRTIGRQHAYAVGRLAAPSVRWLGRALGPLASLLIWVGNAVTPGRGFREGPFALPVRFGGAPAGRGEENGRAGPDMTVELREIMDLAEQSGAVEHGERQMIHSVFSLGDTVVREVMVPRTEMVWIEAHKTLNQALVLALRSGFSRIPVIGASVDDVLGVAYLKDIVRARTERAQRAEDRSADQDVAARHATGDGGSADLRLGAGDIRVDRVMREAVFVPESKPVDDLLSEMQAARVHLAIVVDEYGGTAGLVTIEDILEEIVGEITDEYDVERPPVEHLGDGTVRVTARLPIEDLGELFDVVLPAEEVETVAGLLAQELGRVPIPGAAATVGGLRLVAEGTTGRRNRIETVLVHRVDPNGAAPDTDQASADGRDARTEERQSADA